MKLAYLIIAHNQPKLLQRLVNAIDDPRNDIFIHIDKKSNIDEFSGITSVHSKIFFCPTRINVRWGHISQPETELVLMSYAHDCGPYDYYHLLSGIDYPLHSQDYIHSFMESHNGAEYIGFGGATR